MYSPVGKVSVSDTPSVTTVRSIQRKDVFFFWHWFPEFKSRVRQNGSAEDANPGGVGPLPR